MIKELKLDKLGKSISIKEILNSIEYCEKDIVYIGGSLIEGIIEPCSKGMGNKYSDLDVFIIREHSDFLRTDCVYSGKVKKTCFNVVNGIGCDIEIYDIERILQVIESISKAEIQEDERVLNYIKYPKGWDLWTLNSFYNRIHSSICIFGETKYLCLKENLKIQKFMEIYKYHLLNEIDNKIDDVKGNIDCNELFTALLCMRDICNDLMWLILLNSQIMCDRKKWIWLKYNNYVTGNDEKKEFYEKVKYILFGSIPEKELESTLVEFMSQIEHEIENILVGELDI